MLNNLECQNMLEWVRKGQCTTSFVADALAVSQRHIQRLRRQAYSLKREPRIPWNRKSQEVVNLVVNLKEEYPHRSNQRIAELVRERLCEPICAMTVRKILIDEDKYHPKQYTSKIYSRFEAEAFGQMLQLDTTEGCWLEGYRRIYLILLVDDYSRMIVGARWVDSDSTWNNMRVIREVLEKYGKPSAIYTDNSSKFKTIRHNQSIYQNHKDESEYETEIQRAMRELGITFFSHKPYEPTSKGKIERLFRFIQERFITEHTAKNLNELNCQFVKWIDWYNNQHIVRTTKTIPKERITPNGWTPLLANDDLDRIISYKDSRKVDKRHQFTYQGEVYTLSKEPCVVACRIQLEITPNDINCYRNDQLLATFTRLKNI